MSKINIAVLGANGQLGQSLQQWHKKNNPAENCFFFTSSDLDITDKNQLENQLLQSQNFDYIINCAAYTAVDQAEFSKEKADEVNHLGVKNLAEICQVSNSTLLHISTDSVFDGKMNRPLTEKDIPNPINYYGLSKLKGEKQIQSHLEKYFILRTGWLYSSFGKNFFKTVQRLAKNNTQISMIYDQVGTPTHTSVLIKAILKIIHSHSQAYGVYHIANEGVASWYDFAYEILQFSNSKCLLNLILTEDYPTPAKRPAYSVLDKSKFKKEFNISFPHWKESLKDCF